MGIHANKRGTVQRSPRAHLERTENGEIFGVYRLGFSSEAKRFKYCFIGTRAGVLTFDGREITRHPRFKNISQFEGWCMRYTAEHDL